MSDAHHSDSQRTDATNSVSGDRPEPEPEPGPTAEELALAKHLRQLLVATIRKPPYCQGTMIDVPADDLVLYYGRGDNARRLDLANASPEELQHLADTCDPATFGRGREDVYDEAYRKAGKLDTSEFMIRFTPESLGLLDIVRAELLVERYSSTVPIRAELYKLNVYGEGAFFKAHVDTPRSDTMFGSLVVVFPTPHEGGALTLRENTDEGAQEWTFDSAVLLAAAAPKPSLAYVAFYSDVEHEVMPVQSGHRVTVTYNLYYVDEDATGAAPSTRLGLAHPIPTNEGTFRQTFQHMLEDPDFLPKGGNLLFPLRHQYPLSTTLKGLEERKQALQNVAARLKTADALLLRVVRELGLDAALKVVYEERRQFSTGRTYTMCDCAAPLDNVWADDSMLSGYLQNVAGGVLLNPPAWKRKWLDPGSFACVHWVKTVRTWQVNSVKATYMAHGNQAELAYAYWKPSLLVRVGPAGDRTTPVQVVKGESSTREDTDGSEAAEDADREEEEDKDEGAE